MILEEDKMNQFVKLVEQSLGHGDCDTPGLMYNNSHA